MNVIMYLNINVKNYKINIYNLLNISLTFIFLRIIDNCNARPKPLAPAEEGPREEEKF